MLSKKKLVPEIIIPNKDDQEQAVPTGLTNKYASEFRAVAKAFKHGGASLVPSEEVDGKATMVATNVGKNILEHPTMERVVHPKGKAKKTKIGLNLSC